jgi:hypothetical protein
MFNNLFDFHNDIIQQHNIANNVANNCIINLYKYHFYRHDGIQNYEK